MEKQQNKTLVLINKFSSVVGYKINIQKSVVMLHTCNEWKKNKTKEKIPYLVSSKTINY